MNQSRFLPLPHRLLMCNFSEIVDCSEGKKKEGVYYIQKRIPIAHYFRLAVIGADPPRQCRSSRWLQTFEEGNGNQIRLESKRESSRFWCYY